MELGATSFSGGARRDPMRRIQSVLIGFLFGSGALGCGAANDQSTYASCLREPRSWGEGATRTGQISAFRMENDYSSYGSPEGVFRASITRSSCKDSLHVTGPGVDFQGGPWLPLWESGFAANYKKNRLAFAYYTGEHRAFVWIDGAVRGPYHEISVSPRFSESGEHVAYLVTEPDGTFTLHTDQRRTTHHPRVSDWPFLYVLDDGRLAASSYQKGEKDPKIIVVVGDYNSAPMDELCSNWGFQPGPKGHYGFAAKLQGRWITIIDGEKVPVSGLPSRCEIKFSEDGRRSGYVSTAVAGEPASKQGLVLDRVYHPELEQATDFVFQGAIPVATMEDKRAAGGTKVLVLVGFPTPGVAPSPDDAAPARAPDPEGVYPRPSTRVKIGDSVGPKLDVFEWKTLAVDEAGHVHYQGERSGVKVDLVDNVIQSPPKAGPAVAR